MRFHTGEVDVSIIILTWRKRGCFARQETNCVYFFFHRAGVSIRGVCVSGGNLALENAGRLRRVSSPTDSNSSRF